MNFSVKKYGLILVAAAAAALVFIMLAGHYAQGGDRSGQIGFTPVNDQMQKLIEDTAGHSESAAARASQRDSKPSTQPNIVKGAAKEDISAAAASIPPTETTAAPDKATPTPAITKSSDTGSAEAIKSKTASEISGRIDLNTATLEQLDTLPGIGESKAKAILVYRKEKGVFKKVEDLLQVKGIGEKLLAKIKPLVYAAQP